MATQILKFKRTVNAAPAEVYRVFTNSTALREWLCNSAQASPHKGGRLYLGWNSGYYAAGEFTAVVPNKKIAFTWRGRGEPDVTRVRVSLAEREGGTIVSLTHSGIGTGKAYAKTVTGITHGWQVALENLQSVLETGQDLRYVRRPMLGINVSDFNTEIAAKLGVPVTEGVRLDGVIEKMGAHAAGLRKDDVIVKMGNKKITGFVALATALQRRRAGDKLPVVFYRGSERKTVTMELSRRPLPDVPWKPTELSEAVRRLYAAQDTELAQCFQGTSEQEASHKP
ncbi:MAG: SRPBCC domain-containing protein, partial [Chloroflexota bacterium]|nr:SRPBCC domain-containing protein [Chloroflexota bacterium]